MNGVTSSPAISTAGRGPLENESIELGAGDVRGILACGGTILGSSRTNPEAIEGGVDRIDNVRAAGLDGLIAIGGDDTLGVARILTESGLGVVGVPKTIDNDLNATDYTFGFDTAVNIVMESLDRLPHDRHQSSPPPGGRGDGSSRRLDRASRRDGRWRRPDSRAGRGVRPRAGLPSGQPQLRGRVARSSSLPGAIPAEGSELTTAEGTDAFGHVRLGGIGGWLAERIEENTGHETRSVVLGHLQRGGNPDRLRPVLATRLGSRAIRRPTKANGAP